MSRLNVFPHESRLNRAFARTDLVASIALAALAGAVAVPLLAAGRHESVQSTSLRQLQNLLRASVAFSNDNADDVAGFRAQGGVPYVPKSGLPSLAQTPANDNVAAALEAFDLIHHRTIPNSGLASTPPVGWLPNIAYSPLVLTDYLGRSAPDPFVVDPGNTYKRRWQMDPESKFNTGFWLPFQPAPGGTNARWPYSSTWQQTFAAFDGSPVNARVSQQQTTNTYLIPSGHQFGERTMAEVDFPAMKVFWFAEEELAGGVPVRAFFDPAATIPVGCFDGSAQFLATAAANMGGCPNQPLQPSGWVCNQLVYQPLAWQAPGPQFINHRYYRETRSGLKGRDISGAEIISNAY